MSRSFQCEALHGDISQSERERTLAGFRDGRFNILIATDVASRGLDIPNVDLVCASPSLSYLHYFLLQSPCASSVVYPSCGSPCSGDTFRIAKFVRDIRSQIWPNWPCWEEGHCNCDVQL
jgi:hypothetical protein